MRVYQRCLTHARVAADDARGTAIIMKTLSRLATALFIFAVPLFLVTANVRFAASETRLHRWGFREYNVDQTTRMSFDELDRADEDIVRYFADDRSSLRVRVTVAGQETQLFTDEETLHMRDVKTLIRAVYRLNEASLAVIIAYVGAVVLWSRERSIRQLAKSSLIGLAVGVAFVAVVGGLAATGFDAAWTQFHELAFRNDAWQLDPDTDRLIQMFPEPFWQDMTFLVGGLTLVEALLVLAVAGSYLLRTRRPGPESGESYVFEG